MISSLLQFIQQFLNFFIWWTVIQPWEQGIRVRLGKRRTLLFPGVHLKIPYADLIYRQPIRLCFSSFGPQTVTSRDGKTVTLAGITGFSVEDVNLLFDSLQHPVAAIDSMAMALIAEDVQSHDLENCNPNDIAARCRARMSLDKYGLCLENLSITTFAVVRTYRLIQDSIQSVWSGGTTMKHDGVSSD